MRKPRKWAAEVVIPDPAAFSYADRALIGCWLRDLADDLVQRPQEFERGFRSRYIIERARRAKK